MGILAVGEAPKNFFSTLEDMEAVLPACDGLGAISPYLNLFDTKTQEELECAILSDQVFAADVVRICGLAIDDLAKKVAILALYNELWQ